ncbi:MAG: Bacterial regulatory protein luxR family [Solirubrobacteraceae bacterium]|nr:Bacterial regulatory protein luxR family [Solirubrobacteraceae bacterium]
MTRELRSNVSLDRTSGLSAAERMTVARLGRGEAPRDIAAARGVSLAMVRKTIASAKRKTRARTLAELVALNAQAGLIGGAPASYQSGATAVGTLSNLQQRIVVLLADGLRYRDIAARLSVSERQLQRHVQTAIERLGLRTTAELVAVMSSQPRSGSPSESTVLLENPQLEATPIGDKYRMRAVRSERATADALPGSRVGRSERIDALSGLPRFGSVLQEVKLEPELAESGRQWLRLGIEEARSFAPTVDAYRYEQLAIAVLNALLDGSLASGGLWPGKLAEKARLSRSRIGSYFGRDWQIFTDVVVRAICAQARRPPVYEEILSVPVSVSRDDQGLGVDHVPGAQNVMHLLTWAIASSDMHCPTLAHPLTTGTRDDRTSPRSDPERIATHEHQIFRNLPASMAENVAHLLMSGSERLGEKDPLRPGFASRFLVVGPLPFGPPSRHHLSSSVWLPGSDEEIAKTIHRSALHGILYVGRQTDHLDSSFRRLIVDEWPLRGALNIARPFGVEYLWSKEHALLFRRAGSRADNWRLVNTEEQWLPMAAAIIEHRVQHDWRATSIERWAREANPGLIRARHPVTRQGCLDLINAASAAAIVAQLMSRERESRTDHTSGYRPQEP